MCGIYNLSLDSRYIYFVMYKQCCNTFELMFNFVDTRLTIRAKLSNFFTEFLKRLVANWPKFMAFCKCGAVFQSSPYEF